LINIHTIAYQVS